MPMTDRAKSFAFCTPFFSTVNSRWCHQKSHRHFPAFSATLPLLELLVTAIIYEDPRALGAAETLNKE